MNSLLISNCFAVIMIVSSSSSLMGAPLKVAIIDMKKALTQYHKTVAAEAEEKVEREDIQKDNAERIEAIKAMEQEMIQLRGEFQDSTLSKEKRQGIAKSFSEREQTMGALRREREEFIQRRGRALNQKMVAKLDIIRADVQKKVDEHAASVEVDYVFDSSGLTSAQVPFLLYVRNKVDITDDVLTLLNKDVPAPPASPTK